MTTNLDMNLGKGGHLFTAGRSADWCSHYGNQCNVFQKYGTAIGIKDSASFHKDTCSSMFTSALLTIDSQQMEIA